MRNGGVIFECSITYSSVVHWNSYFDGKPLVILMVQIYKTLKFVLVQYVGNGAQSIF